MKKYQVVSNLSKPSWKHQELRVFDIDYGQTSTFNITIDKHEPKFSPGNIINVYASQKSGSYGHPLALTYYINNRLYINIQKDLKTKEDIIDFYKSFEFLDKLNFNITLIQVLLQHRITPALNKHKNLELFLNTTHKKSY